MTTFIAAFAGSMVGTIVCHYTGVRALLTKLLAEYGIVPKD